MPTDDYDEYETESGSSLRRKLEETISEKQELATELAGLKAKELIQERGYGLVKTEDLLDVDLNEMAERAESIQAERHDQQAYLARDILAKRGLTGEELDKAVEDFLAPPDTVGDVAAHSRTREVAAIGGTAAPIRNTENLMGLDAIDAALRRTAKS